MIPSTFTAPPPQTGLLAFASGQVPDNLLVISLDTTRRDRLGRYSGLGTTPFLDARLAEGVALDDHRSCSNWTAPSMICATTGQTPMTLGFWPGSGDPQVAGVPERMPTLARKLSAAGVGTRLVTGNPVFSNDYGAADGFDLVVLRDFEDADVIAARGFEQAEALLATASPFYLHLHFMDPV